MPAWGYVLRGIGALLVAGPVLLFVVCGIEAWRATRILAARNLPETFGWSDDE